MQPRADRLEVGWAVFIGLRDVGKPEDFPAKEGLCSGTIGAIIGGNFRNDDFCMGIHIYAGALIFLVP